MELSQTQEPQILRQLRQKTLTLQLSIDKESQRKKQNHKEYQQLQKQLQKLRQQKQIQHRKNKSLIVLLNELQQMYYQNYLQHKLGNINDDDENAKINENTFLRHVLIKQTENNKQLSKVLNLFKQLQLDKNKTKAKEFIKKSNFLQNQAEVIAKLRSQLATFNNQNLECTRKWYELQQQMRKIENEEKLYKIQVQRQKTQLKQQYEDYLERMNEAKMKLVTFNETQKQSIITEYYVKQVAILQQKRVEIEEQNRNLKYHYENLQEELNRINIQNKQLKSFFIQNNQESVLATKMKTRIEELRDVLIEFRKKNKDTRSVRLTKVVDNIRKELKNIGEANDLLEMRIRDQADYGCSLDDKPIAEFFQKILQEKDKQLLIMKERQNSLLDDHRQLQVKKNLLESQITNLEENVKFDDYETHHHEESRWRNTGWEKQRMSDKSGTQVNKQSNWKKITKETDRALGMDTYFQGSFR